MTSATPIPEPENPFAFPLDTFQKHAVDAISRDENVLVTAKTGSGKTLVGEYQILHSLKKGKRVFYTTPIKSLSNQKFHDLKQMHPSVGIMTGDIKFMPQADIVIMTTEILRNLLFKKGTSTENIGITASLSMDNVDSIIFDEVHYINDIDRGKIWEECFVLMPREINMVLLSATIDKPEIFAAWLAKSKNKPIHLISTEYRVVPLVHTLPNGKVLMDAKEKFNDAVYREWLYEFNQTEKSIDLRKQAVASREEGQDAIEKTARNYSFLYRMNDLINKGLKLPALFFVMSRKNCVIFAQKVEGNLITSSEVAAMKHIVSFHLHRYPDVILSNQYFQLMAVLEKGVAFHHSGVLPILKEIVEILFGKGLIKVLFATETFAVGLNMPTKTVVFTSLRKPSSGGNEFRMLHPHEYTQMAGRAGRRGKDTEGVVVYLPLAFPEPLRQMQEMMTGKKAGITSRLKFDYPYILQTMQSGVDVSQNSFWDEEQQTVIQKIKKDVLGLKSQYNDLSGLEEMRCDERAQIEEMPNSKQKQTLMNTWGMKHMGPKWKIAWESYQKNEKLSNTIRARESDIEAYTHTRDDEIYPRKVLLEKWGFIKDDNTITQKGVLATEVHEGHPLLMATAFFDKMWHSSSDAIEIVIALSGFLEYQKNDNDVPLHDRNIAMIQQIAQTMCSDENIQKCYSDWNITHQHSEWVKRWMNGVSSKEICAEFMDEGTFVRNVLKLSNLVDEWRNLAIIMQDTEMIEKMKDIQIVREVVIPDSLYLRI